MTKDQKVTAWALYCPGVAGMARDDNPDSGNSQFFLMRDAYPSLEKRYTAWGRVIAGQDVVRAIKAGEPVEPIRRTGWNGCACWPICRRRTARRSA